MMSSQTQGIKHLHLQPEGGIAGDMFLAALLGLGASPESITDAFASLKIPGLELCIEDVEVEGIASLYVRSLAPDLHHHTQLHEVLERIEQASASRAAKNLATGIFEILAAAEAKVHGGESGDVHLHEVGALDSVMDILGGAIAYTEVGAPKVTYESVPIGHGQVKTSHGFLDIPVPAVQEIVAAHNLVTQPVDVAGETMTPTGAALLAGLSAVHVQDFSGSAGKQGVGAGTLRFPGRANVLKAIEVVDG